MGRDIFENDFESGDDESSGIDISLQVSPPKIIYQGLAFIEWNKKIFLCKMGMKELIIDEAYFLLIIIINSYNLQYNTIQ